MADQLAFSFMTEMYHWEYGWYRGNEGRVHLSWTVKKYSKEGAIAKLKLLNGRSLIRNRTITSWVRRDLNSQPFHYQDLDLYQSSAPLERTYRDLQQLQRLNDRYRDMGYSGIPYMQRITEI